MTLSLLASTLSALPNVTTTVRGDMAELAVSGRFVAMLTMGLRSEVGAVVATRQTGRRVGVEVTKALRTVGPVIWA